MTFDDYPMRAIIQRQSRMEEKSRSGRSVTMPITFTDIPCYITGAAGHLLSGGEVPVRRTDIKVINISGYSMFAPGSVDIQAEDIITEITWPDGSAALRNVGQTKVVGISYFDTHLEADLQRID